jgi:hypothetical protein
MIIYGHVKSAVRQRIIHETPSKNRGTEGAVIQQIRPAMTADPRALVAAVERSQILLLRPAACARIPYQDDVDIAVLEWIASQARNVRQFPRRVI